jgi:hypothetical protein
MRIKHGLNGNSLKRYDKGSVLRAACLIHEPGDFQVYRAAEGDPEGPKDWRPLRQGIADLHRRAEVSPAAHGRYLDALTAVHDATPLRHLAEPLCRPAPVPRRSSPPPAPAEPHPAPAAATRRATRPLRVRALNPLAAAAAALRAVVRRPDFLRNGLGNRDLRRRLYRAPAATAAAVGGG